jgi:hypothetical protein
MPVGGSALLRLIRRLKLPAVPAVEVLGVEEFAFRRGRKFGTILVGMHSRRPVDVLPDHTADPSAAWLQGRDHVRTVCRVRDGSFAEGAQRALPDIPHVAEFDPPCWTAAHTVFSAAVAGGTRVRVAGHQKERQVCAALIEDTSPGC